MRKVMGPSLPGLLCYLKLHPSRLREAILLTLGSPWPQENGVSAIHLQGTEIFLQPEGLEEDPGPQMRLKSWLTPQFCPGQMLSKGAH